MAPFNKQDPRYQREEQRADAKRSMGAPVRGVARAVTGEIAGRHAGYQLGRQQQFEGLALRSKLAEQQHKQALVRAGQWDQNFGLQQRNLGFRESEFGEKIKREKSGLNRTMIMGGLTAGWAELEGRRRAELTRIDAAERRADRALLQDYIMSVRAPYGYRATSEEQ